MSGQGQAVGIDPREPLGGAARALDQGLLSRGRGALRRHSHPLREWFAFGFISLMVLLAVFADWIPGLVDPSVRYGPFSQYPDLTLNGFLGTDALGRSIVSRIIYGAQISLTIAAVATVMALAGGILLGMVAGFYRGVPERFVDLYANALAVIPPILMILALVTVTGASLFTITVALGIRGIGPYARIAKGAVISQAGRDYVLAGRALGATDPRLLSREILPNLVPTLTAIVPTQMAGLIITEGSLSFLGFGIPSPAPSWGGMIAGATNLLDRFPLLVMGPILAIVLTVYSLNTIGDYFARRIDVREGQL